MQAQAISHAEDSLREFQHKFRRFHESGADIRHALLALPPGHLQPCGPPEWLGPSYRASIEHRMHNVVCGFQTEPSDYLPATSFAHDVGGKIEFIECTGPIFDEPCHLRGYIAGQERLPGQGDIGKFLELAASAWSCTGCLSLENCGLPRIEAPAPGKATGPDAKWRDAIRWLLTLHRLAWRAPAGRWLRAEPLFFISDGQVDMDEDRPRAVKAIELIDVGRFDLNADAQGLDYFCSTLPGDVASCSAAAIEMILAGLSVVSEPKTKGRRKKPSANEERDCFLYNLYIDGTPLSDIISRLKEAIATQQRSQTGTVWDEIGTTPGVKVAVDRYASNQGLEKPTHGQRKHGRPMG